MLGMANGFWMFHFLGQKCFFRFHVYSGFLHPQLGLVTIPLIVILVAFSGSRKSLVGMVGLFDRA